MGTIFDLIRGWADVQPDAPAFLADGANPMSYRQLASLLNDFQAVLHGSGFTGGDRLAVVHRGGAEMAAALMGAMSAAAASPVNPESTAAEFEKQFRLRGIDGVIVDRDLNGPARTVAASLGLPVIEVERADPETTGAVRLIPVEGGEKTFASAPGPQDVAVVLTTSGTSSEIKVVPLRHHLLMRWATASAATMRLGPNDRMLHLVPLYYASGVVHTFRMLSAGGSLAFLQVGEMRTFFDAVEQFDPTWYTGGPTVQDYVREMASRKSGPGRNRSLRFIRTSSSSLDPKLALDLERILGVPVITGYGMTEAGPIATNPVPPRDRKHGSVGLPVVGEVRIMDETGKLLPAGARGEVVVREDRVFDGYENDPEATETAFIDGWFRTGDEGYFDEDGYLFLCGRIKEIINCGGEKVYPMEVDAALLGLPGVKEAAVFPAPHPTMGEMVVAAIVPDEGQSLDERKIAGALRTKLSRFKVPRRFLFLDSLPRSPTGKIQRMKLTELLAEHLNDEAQEETRAERRPPTVLEAELLKIFSATLRRDDIGLNDDFYELGGDSLRAIELFLEFERKLGLIMPSGLSAEAGTVAELAGKIEAGDTRRCLVPIQPAGKRYPLFFVPGRNGQLVGLLQLAQALGTDQPFYGFQTYVWFDADDPYPVTSTAELVRLYVKEIRSVQPTGPYFIGGRSFGGRLACYIAQELKAAGEEVALLVMIDSYCRAGRRYIGLRRWLAQRSTPGKTGRLLAGARFVQFRVKKSASDLRDRIRKAAVHAAWRVCRELGLRPPWFSRKPSQLMNGLVRFEHKHMRPYEGAAVYFKAALGEGSTAHPDVHEAWPRLFPGGLDVREVGGDHFGCARQPHVEGLAAQLDECLRGHGVVPENRSTVSDRKSEKSSADIPAEMS